MDLDLPLHLNFLYLVQCAHLFQKVCCTPFLVWSWCPDSLDEAAVPKEDPNRRHLEFSWYCFEGIVTNLNETELLDAQECNLSNIVGWSERPELQMEGDVLEEGYYSFMLQASKRLTFHGANWAAVSEVFFFRWSLRCDALTMGPRGKFLLQERLGGWFAWVHEVCPLCFWRCRGKMANKSLRLEIWAQQLQKSMVLLLVLFLIGPGTGCWLKLVLSWQSYKLQCVLSSAKCWEHLFFFLHHFNAVKWKIHAVDSASCGRWFIFFADQAVLGDFVYSLHYRIQTGSDLTKTVLHVFISGFLRWLGKAGLPGELASVACFFEWI